MTTTQRLAELLQEERDAALAADVDTLERLQEDKRALLDEVREIEGAASETWQSLGQRARANVLLMRQMVAFQRALLGLDSGGAGYGASGEPAMPAGPATTRRGVL